MEEAKAEEKQRNQVIVKMKEMADAVRAKDIELREEVKRLAASVVRLSRSPSSLLSADALSATSQSLNRRTRTARLRSPVSKVRLFSRPIVFAPT